ncbi:MAG: Alpha-galactosidase A [Candidatus Ordinivivax streblomastigis]|uniref:Alpha-galactosidase n=1 Tax=Candidatus Ordinivivax streblomastigis TaxID=2540710 RepID=A0A5M8NU01_9BACT|nr:MAG: Alpha-galactosidase A [Candidatus Ordinivivax streblomastigis]
MKKLLIFILLFSASLGISAQKFENLGKTPQMGWNSWNTFVTNINEQLIKEVADVFIQLGLKDAGYEYILLDDGWMDMQRDVQGNLVPHPEKFPNGIKTVVDYVHSKGLKFGLYNCAGDKTCAGYPGSRGHEYQDALKYAEWGVDYLKYDWCNTGGLNAEEAYITMRDALYAAGRPVFFSLCEWGDHEPWTWATSVGHSWRTTGDIYDCFDCVYDHGTWKSWGMYQILNMHDQNLLRQSAGPGHWNDMDMLEVGKSGFGFYENQTHFALWAMLNSPLVLGNDLRTINRETLNIVTNKGIIALNQDTLGIQGFKYTTIGQVEIWVKPLSNDEWAFCFFNYGEPTEFLFDWMATTVQDDGFNKQVSFTKNNVYKIVDLYAQKEIGKTDKTIKKKLNKNQSLVVRLSK